MAAHDLHNLSKHLFWDVKDENLDADGNKAFIIKRVLEYGNKKDWQFIVNLYGLEEIAKEVKRFKDLDPKSLSFVSVMTDTPLQEFRCYTTRQSHPEHWNF